MKDQRVGVGTSTPYARLGVWGSGTTLSQMFSLTNNASSTKFVVLDNGNVGIATTSPSAQLTITGTSTATNTTHPFLIATSSNAVPAASSTMFMVDRNGDVHLGGGTPVLSSCGTNARLGANSTDQAGTITAGAGASGCVVTFYVPKASVPQDRDWETR